MKKLFLIILLLILSVNAYALDKPLITVLEESGDVWSHTTTLSGSLVADGDAFFGFAVDITPDGSIIAAGVSWASAGGSAEGQVCIFEEPACRQLVTISPNASVMSVAAPGFGGCFILI